MSNLEVGQSVPYYNLHVKINTIYLCCVASAKNQQVTEFPILLDLIQLSPLPCYNPFKPL